MKRYLVRSTDIATPVVVPVDTRYNKWIVNVTYFDSADFDVTAVPTVGTVVVSGVSAPDEWAIAFSENPLDANDENDAISFSGKLKEITFIPSGIDVATHFLMTIVGRD